VARRPPNLSVESDRSANLLAAAAQLVVDAVAQRLRDTLPRSVSAPATLMTINHHPGLSIETLRLALDLTHSGTVRLIDRLEADDLVRRRKRAGREVELLLTRRGVRIVERIERARIAAAAELLAALRDEQRRQLDGMLADLLAAHTEDEEDLRRICRLCSFDACENDRQTCPVSDALAH
jgi:DNA-binding MarR family transcriptional regulator